MNFKNLSLILSLFSGICLLTGCTAKPTTLSNAPWVIRVSNGSGLRGYFLMPKTEFGNPQFGLDFIDDTHVQMYANGNVAGPMCTYKINGNSLLLTHACGVWHLKIGSDRLHYIEEGWDFFPQKEG